jgi:hypothetical protein
VVMGTEETIRFEKLDAVLASIAEDSKRRAAEFDEDSKRRAAEFDEDSKRRAAELDEYSKRRAAELAEDSKRRAAEFDEDSKRRAAKLDEEFKKHKDEFNAEMAASRAEFEKRLALLDARIAATNDTVKGIGKSNGMFAEDIFYRTLWREKEFAGVHFDDVSDQFGGIKKLPGGKRLQDQFDIVMLNDVAAAILESKYRARKEDVTTLVEKKLKNFKIMFPDYKDLKIHLGLAALSFEDDVVEEARKYGVGLLQQVGETVEYATDWEVKAY